MRGRCGATGRLSRKWLAAALVLAALLPSAQALVAAPSPGERNAARRPLLHLRGGRAGTEASSEKLVKGTGTGTVKAFDQAVLTISMAAAAARDKMGLKMQFRGKREAKKEVLQQSEKLNYAKSGGLLFAAVVSTIALEMMSDLLYVEVFFGLQAYQLLISGSYALFFCANLIPGRLDTKLGRPKREDLRFFTPAGFTFAIWAPIFLGELLMALSAFAPGSLATPSSVWLQDMAPSYAAASFYQALWCLAFRDWALQYQWVPASLLTLAAVALYRAHFHIAASYSAGTGTIWSLVACRIPVALHFGWITAAAALSWNGQLAAMGTAVETRLTAAIATCFLAALFLGGTAISRREGWPSLTAAWALYGVSKGHEVLRGAVDNVALDALNNVATLCSGACVGMSALAWLSFLSYY